MIRTPFSASNFHRRRACPGSQEMERNLPRVENEWSEEGGKLHHTAATQDYTGLSQEQEEVVVQALGHRNRFWKSIGLNTDAEFHTEVELSYTLAHGTSFLNHADIIGVSQTILGIVDYKFGFEEVDAPDMNQQLAVYIAAAAQFWVAEEYYGLIIPRFGKPAPPVKYTREEIPALRKMIEETYYACTKDAPRMPSLKACRYCKGFQLGVCKEAREMALSGVSVPSTGTLLPISPEAMLTHYAPEERTQLFDAFKMAADLRMTFTKAAKTMLEKDPEFIPGYRLSKEGETREKVNDMLSLMERLHSGLALRREEFITASSISKTSLANLVRLQTGLKGRELDEKIAELTKGLVDITPVERSLERK